MMEQNELSRGLREVPEYKAVTSSPKMPSKQMNKLASIFADYLAFRQKSKSWLKLIHARMLLSKEKTQIFQQVNPRERSLSRFLLPTQQQLSIYLSDIEKIIFEPVSILQNSILSV